MRRIHWTLWLGVVLLLHRGAAAESTDGPIALHPVIPRSALVSGGANVVRNFSSWYSAA